MKLKWRGIQTNLAIDSMVRLLYTQSVWKYFWVILFVRLTLLFSSFRFCFYVRYLTLIGTVLLTQLLLKQIKCLHFDLPYELLYEICKHSEQFKFCQASKIILSQLLKFLNCKHLLRHALQKSYMKKFLNFLVSKSEEIFF